MRFRLPLRIALIGMPIASEPDDGIIAGLMRYAEEHGAWRYVFAAEATVDAIRFLSKVQCHGAVVRLVNMEMARAARKIRIPMVNVSTWLEDPKVPTVCSDSNAVGRLAAEHLLQRGFRHFGCVACPGGAYIRGRTNGFVQALEEQGFACPVHVIHPHRSDISSPQQLTQADLKHLEEWLRRLKPQTGLFWTEDHLGNDLILTCGKLGLQIPRDVAVVSAPNRAAVCEASDPPLSSIDACLDRIGYVAAQWLDRLIAGEVMNGGRISLPNLRVVARKSSDTFAARHPAIVEAVNFIHENLASGVNASDAVNRVNLPRSTFYRLFNEDVGCSPKEYIQTHRVARAKELLASGKLGAQAVADACGFGGRFQMERALRRKLKLR